MYKILDQTVAGTARIQSVLQFLHENNFDWPDLFPNVWTFPNFGRVYCLSLCCDKVLHYVRESLAHT